MTTLLFVRHGFSTSNEDGTLTGQLDVPLTELGVLQGEAACRYIDEHYTPDAIYSSDLLRAVDTVRPLAARTGLPIRTTPALREMHCGIWEGEAVTRLKETYGEHYERWANVSDEATPDGGESWSETARRAYEEVLRIVKENDGKTVVIATHGGTLRALRGAYLGLPLADWKEKLPFAPNASLTVTVVEDGCFSEKAIIDGYLGTNKTEMPKGI